MRDPLLFHRTLLLTFRQATARRAQAEADARRKAAQEAADTALYPDEERTGRMEKFGSYSCRE